MEKYKNNQIPANAGIGLRSEHYDDFLVHHNQISWCEVHPENYFGRGGKPHQYLEKIRALMPLSFHGVGMSIGSVDQLETRHLNRLNELIDIYQPDHVSEHISWSAVDGIFMNDLLPIPYTQESLDHVCEKIDQVQSAVKRKILMENASTYLEFADSTIPEAEFVNAMAKRTGCGILLDINNVYVSCKNHHFDPYDYLKQIDYSLVGEFHLAGHTTKTIELESHVEQIRIDTHNQPVCDDVWDLYRFAVKVADRAIPTLIEWDTDLPPIKVLFDEAQAAQHIMDEAHVIAA